MSTDKYRYHNTNMHVRYERLLLFVFFISFIVLCILNYCFTSFSLLRLTIIFLISLKIGAFVIIYIYSSIEKSIIIKIFSFGLLCTIFYSIYLILSNDRF